MEELVNQGVTIIAYEKKGIKYGMTCAWATHCDYDSLLMLIGSQSDTGNSLEVGDIVGVSALASNQKEIANLLGSKHSKSCDKFTNVRIIKHETAIMIPNSKSNLVCEVIDIGHIIGEDKDHLVQLKVIKHYVNDALKFLSMSDLR